MIFDCHCHSSISSDSPTPMADMAAAAAAHALGITFTEHVDCGFPSPKLKNADAAEYLDTFRTVREAHPDYAVLRGVELGFEYGFEAESKAFVRAIDPDLVICSVHSLDGMTLYCDEKYPEGHQHEVYSRYLAKVRDSIRLCRDFDVVGHIGFVAKRAKYPDPQIEYDEFRDELDEILRLIIDTGHALEANTSGFLTVGGTLPQRAILRRYRELGGELLTIGSDAHRPQYVGFHFPDAIEMIKSCGFTHLTHYEKRKAVLLPL